MWPGAGVVGDRGLISEFTGEDADKLGGFPVNSPDCMVLDQSVNNSWKNLAGVLNETFQKRKPSRKTIQIVLLKISVKRRFRKQIFNR